MSFLILLNFKTLQQSKGNFGKAVIYDIVNTDINPPELNF